ncbi:MULTISPECIES: chalcone isomerase family protein [unclassified Pseudoalteromonas]|uniref:chalcone isomerase family protein n=1 Tax=unclassified Pseudoalteromonas TaxID=194690 RepID=UPI00209781CB|nr:chalcone isomerase family protein [Pseudoalteromonas sp. XMcav2-N]MCO7187833.1 chalcone isomerase family protein [Pseudoalteromonas sp. XMcav2-N]
MFSRLGRKLITAAAILVAAQAGASTATQLPTLELRGTAELRYLFWDIYSAALYTSGGRYQETEFPQVLKLTYKRDIEAQELVDATREQWQKQKLKLDNSEQWLRQLGQLWPDIRKGNQLILVVDKEQQSRFYFRPEAPETLKVSLSESALKESARFLGAINDSAFGPAFLGIWLSEKTTEPKLRKQLIGKR